MLPASSFKATNKACNLRHWHDIHHHSFPACPSHRQRLLKRSHESVTFMHDRVYGQVAGAAVLRISLGQVDVQGGRLLYGVQDGSPHGDAAVCACCHQQAADHSFHHSDVQLHSILSDVGHSL